MNLHEKLEQILHEKYTKSGVEFIVMNENTAKNLVKDVSGMNIGVFNKYKGIDVLISETLQDGEFKIG